jgi:hypothetical protein
MSPAQTDVRAGLQHNYSKNNNTMKKICFLIILSFLYTGCKKDNHDLQPKIPIDLIGKWKTIAIYDTDGGSAPMWREFNTGQEYDIWFKNNSEYTQTDSSICNSGKYLVSEVWEITFENSCGDKDVQTIDSLSTHILIIDTKFFETIKIKYVKVGEKSWKNKIH